MELDNRVTICLSNNYIYKKTHMEVECRVYVEARLLIRLGSNMEEEEFPAGPQPGSN